MFNDLLNELTIDILEHGGQKLVVPNHFSECVSNRVSLIVRAICLRL